MDAALPFAEKYRPKKLDEVIGQEHVVDFLRHQLDLYSQRKYSLPHILLIGAPGVGKTAIAGAFFNDLYKDRRGEAVMESNASLDRGIDFVRQDINRFATTKPVGGFPFNICFLDEFDSMTQPAQFAMRRIMERNARSCRFWATANDPMAIIEPIRNRFLSFRCKAVPADKGVEAIRRVAEAEDIRYDEGTLEALFEKTEGSLRNALNALQSIVPPVTMEKVGKIEDATDKQISEIIDLIVKTGGDKKEAHKRMISLIRGGVGQKEIFGGLLKTLANGHFEGKPEITEGEYARQMAYRLADYEANVVAGASLEVQVRCFLFEIEQRYGS